MNKNILAICLSLLVLVTFTSCEKWLDVNETPNNPTDVPLNLLLPAATSGTAFANANEVNRFASTIMQYMAGAGGSPSAYDVYNIAPDNFNNQWNFEFYAAAMQDYVTMIQKAEEQNAPAYGGVAKLQLAYTFSLATDIWGDVPYSEALSGLDVLTPRFDSQEKIYKGDAAAGIQSLFDLVRDGLADLNETSTIKPGALDDLVYGGNMDNWKRMGNTLLLKLAIQISKADPTLATSVINEVITADNYIKDNSQDYNIKFGNVPGSQSPIHTYVNVSLFANDLIASTRFINRLKATNDPRLAKFLTKPGADYVGIDNGFAGARPTPTSNWSRFNSYVTGAPAGSGPVRLITNFQRAFILAEAALMLGTPGDPQALYEEGIRASMTLAGVTTAEIDAYFAANPTEVTLTGTNEEKLAQIITQKYIAWCGNGAEAWNDWRRTGYPTLEVSQNALGEDGTIPARLPYPTNEIERNPNIPTPQPRTNQKVWWDVN